MTAVSLDDRHIDDPSDAPFPRSSSRELRRCSRDSAENRDSAMTRTDRQQWGVVGGSQEPGRHDGHEPLVASLACRDFERLPDSRNQTSWVPPFGQGKNIVASTPPIVVSIGFLYDCRGWT